MAGLTEETGQTARSMIDALKREPLSLALVIMNLALLGTLFWFGTTVAKQRETEIRLLYDSQKDVRELLSRCDGGRAKMRMLIMPDIPQAPPDAKPIDATRPPAIPTKYPETLPGFDDFPGLPYHQVMPPMGRAAPHRPALPAARAVPPSGEIPPASQRR
jgi:hypothetical protein